MTQNHNLRFKPRSRLEAVAQHADEKEGNCDHQPQLCCDLSTAATPPDGVFVSDRLPRLRVAKKASPSRSVSSRSRCCAKLHPRTLTQNKRSFSPCPAAPLGLAAWRRPENVPDTRANLGSVRLTTS